MNERPLPNRNINRKFSDVTLLLEATKPEGYEEYYNARAPLLGRELSIGIIDKTDMLANDMASWCILELFYEGQTDFAWDYMTWYQNDWKASMSIDGTLIDKLTSDEIRYTQTQHLHEHQDQVKKGFLGGKPKNVPRD